MTAYVELGSYPEFVMGQIYPVDHRGEVASLNGSVPLAALLDNTGYTVDYDLFR